MEQRLKSAILGCLKDLKGSGRFASTHASDFIFPGLEVNGVGEVSFPLNKIQAKELIKVAHKAPFGKGSKTILDSQVRSAWEVDANNITFRNAEWNTFLQKTIEKIKNDLGLTDYVIEAHLYKLLIYEEGDFFLPHKDSEKEKGMFGSLIIGLPSKFTGGELIISFEGEQFVADFSKDSNAYSINCAAFYADCDHEVKPLTSGYRICISYNLIQQASGDKIELQSLNRYAESLANTFTQFQTSKPYIVLLGHQYTPENFSYESLKLNDRYKADALLRSAQKIGCYAKMCLVTSYLTGIPENYGYYGDEDENAKMEEVYDESLEIEHWLPNELPNLDHLSFEEDDLITSFALNKDEPIIKESTGYMGNYGPDLMHWYHYGAVVIWSPEQNAELLPTLNINTQMEWIAYFNQTKQLTEAETDSINTIISMPILENNRYSKDEANFNAIIDWLINNNNESFLLKISEEHLHFLVEKIDTAYWQKMLEWLPRDNRQQFFKKLTNKINLSVIEKLLAIIRSMASVSKTYELAFEQTIHLTKYLETLSKQSSIRLKATSLTDLFWIEQNFTEAKPTFSEKNNLILNKEQWIDVIDKTLTKDPQWQYIHNIFAPQLLIEQTTSMLHTKLLYFCREYLQKRVNNKPQPPANWSRPLPETNRNNKVWKMLEAFMESPHEQIFDFKKAQNERFIMEGVIKSGKVDLKTETIKKGSPHTLRIIKTQASYEHQLKKWHKDVTLLEKVKTLNCLIVD